MLRNDILHCSLPMKHILRGISLILLFLFSLAVSAQQKMPEGINLQNLATVKVDDLSDEQIAEFWKQAQERGLSMVQIQQAATQRNMSMVEFNKLKSRIENLGSAVSSNSRYEDRSEGRKVQDENNRQQPQMQDRETTTRSNMFGAELFSNKNLTFEPNLKLATPSNYQIGPDDELLIDVSGYSEASYKLKVTPEGQIRIPVAGPVFVGGLTIEQAKRKITAQLSGIYSGITSGETSVSIALGNIRSIHVTIIGEVKMPGSYTLPSLATAFNALYASGGPGINGSFRNIKVIRAGKPVATIDVYQFLLKGEAKGDIRLQDQDVIRVGSYETRVELTGEVKRPGFYEVVAGETLKDVIGFAGGYTDVAYRDRIKVFRNTAKEKSVADVPQDITGMFVPQTGDVYTIDKVLERFSNRVQINGAVFRPGFFALDDGMTLSKLIAKADGITEDAFTSRGLIYRLKDDNSLEAISFDVKEVMSGKDIQLKREDNIQILSKLDMREEYKISIAGEVLNPGVYPYAENMRVEDLIITSGGLKESASKTKIEIARKIKSIDVNNTGAPVASIISYEIYEDLKTKEGNDIVLQPFDVVSIYKLPGFQNQRNITIDGEVMHPGQYTLTRNNERISEVLKRAGGMTAMAFPDGAVLIRTKSISGVDKFIQKQKLVSLEKQSSDTSRVKDIEKSDFSENNSSIVGIDLGRILKYPGSDYDLYMEENDVLRIPREMQTVKVSGEVLYPVRIQYKKGKSFRRYVSGAGGYTERALKRRGYVVYANGSAESTRKLLFLINIHPRVKPGAEIILPAKDERKKLTPVEFIGITSAVSSMVFLIYTITSK
jgi:protein involved in polysaccharide export with SLBB domain